MASSGPNSPSTVVNDATVGVDAWSNPSNATTSNDTYAVFSDGPEFNQSQYLKATDFGFSIPTGSTIDFITASFECQTNSGTRGANARIVKGGTISSTEYGFTINATTDFYFTPQNSDDTWGETFTAADINSSTFGVVFTVLGGDVSMDHIRITVTYTEAVITYTLTCTVGAFVLTGIAAVLAKGFALVASVGTFTLTGITTPLSRGLALVAQTASYIATWQVFTAISTALNFTNQSKNSATLTNQAKNSATLTNI